MRKVLFTILALIFSYQLFSQYDEGVIHPAGDSTKMLPSSDCLFEFIDTANTGDEVIGRVNLANNSHLAPNFSIIGGSGLNKFTIENYDRLSPTEKQTGLIKRVGLIKLATDTLTQPTYTLEVRADFGALGADTQTYTIHRVSDLLAEKFFLSVESRKNMTRYGELKNDATIANYISLQQANGTFSDLNYVLGSAGWADVVEGSNRLGSMARSYIQPSSSYYNDSIIKDKIYLGIDSVVAAYFMFLNDKPKGYPWEIADPIAGIGLKLFRELRSEMASTNTVVANRASNVYHKIIGICDGMWGGNMDVNKPNHRFPVLANANRTHRMRMILARAALTYDYNRPLSDRPVWYDTISKRIEGYYPNGVLGDIMELTETNYFIQDSDYNISGFYPDGSTCHHCFRGNEFNFHAYGWAWLTEMIPEVLSPLKNTKYQAQNSTYDFISERLLDSYRYLVYKKNSDFLAAGLSTPDWNQRIVDAIDELIEAKSTSTIIAREAELLVLKNKLTNNIDQLTINKPYWNIDMLIHRRPNYYFSAKMLSTRTRGIERGVEKKSYYYFGDGGLSVMTHGNEYNALQTVMNWHAVPGITAEQRNDTLPLNANSGFKGAIGTNTYAGVVSDSIHGFGAFIYERNHTDSSVNYSTVNANKSYFFYEDEAVALGNKVKRVRPGDGNEIWTILNQTIWNTDVTYNDGTNGNQTLSHSLLNTSNTIGNITNPAWFYHDSVGYIVIPENGQTINMKLITKETTEPNPNNTSVNLKTVELVINHGTNPSNDKYQYIILPAVTQSEVVSYVQKINSGTADIKILQNDSSIIATRDSVQNITQIAFYTPDTISYVSSANDTVSISVDRPALVMVKENGANFEFSVTDPNHSTTNLTTNVTINKLLDCSNCTTNVINGQTTIPFTHSNIPIYAGKTIRRTLTKTVLSIENVSNNLKIKAYPNPTSSIINISFKEVKNKGTISVFDLNGRLLINNKFDHQQTVPVDMTKLIDGVYFIDIKTEKGTSSFKVIKSK